MTQIIKAKLKKSDGQTNIEKYKKVWNQRDISNMSKLTLKAICYAYPTHKNN